MKLYLPAALLLSSVLSANGSVHFVDDDGGPGVFPTIQEAIDAASDGDLVLVEEGEYGSFTIDGKSLSIVGLGPVDIEGLGVARNLGALQTAVLRNLGTPIEEGDAIGFGVNCGTGTGSHWVENCQVDGLNVVRDGTAMWIRNVFNPFLTTFYSGIEIQEDGRALVYDSTFAPEKVIPFFPHGGAANVSDAEAFFSGCIIAGGDGFDCDEGGSCGLAGDGGDGLNLNLDDFVRLRDTVVTKGLAGETVVPGCTNCNSPTVDGEEIVIVSGATEELTGPAISIAATSPVASGSSTTLDVQATVGTTLSVAMFGESPFDLPLDEYGGVLLVAPPYTLLTLPPVDASGAIQATIPIGNFPPSTEFLQVFGQIVVVDPSLGIRLGSATSLEVVRSDLLN